METMLPGMAVLKNNIHPLLTHFPIAFFLGALVMEGMAVLHDERFHLGATWMLYLGTLSALIALPTGFLAADIVAAADPRGHSAPGHHFIHVHRNWMVATTLVGVFFSIYFFRVNQKRKWLSQRWGLLFVLVVLAFLVSLGADRGGRLVFEFGTGVNPEVLKEIPHEAEHAH